jgi:hypothetical protein
MDVIEFSQHLTRLIYLAVAIITLFEFVAYRDETRLDIALMFASFGITVLGQEYEELTGIESGLITLSQVLPLMAQPYLLVRLVGHFRPVPAWVRRLALAGAAVSWLALIAWPSSSGSLPTVLVVPLVVYFVWAEGYAVLAPALPPG